MQDGYFVQKKSFFCNKLESLVNFLPKGPESANIVQCNKCKERGVQEEDEYVDCPELLKHEKVESKRDE